MEVTLSELERSFLASQTSGSRTVKISIKGDGFAVDGVGVVTFSAEAPPAEAAVAVDGEQEHAKKRGYKRKAAAVAELQEQIAERVKKLPAAVTSRFGTVVWAKMRSYPYWPAMIVDPRDLDDPKVQAMALKEMDTKFIVCFYFPRNVCPVLYSDVENWDDTKFDYRGGHPKRDVSKSLRRTQLATAIEMADNDVKLPISERMGGMSKHVTPAPASKSQKVSRSAAAASQPTTGLPTSVPLHATGPRAISAPQSAMSARQPTIALPSAPMAMHPQMHPQYMQMYLPASVPPASIATAPPAVSMPMTSVAMAPQPLYPFDNLIPSIPAAPQLKKRGRPVGSKNRPKDAPPGEKRKPGRPPGSKTKPKVLPPAADFMQPPGQYMLAPVMPQPVAVPSTSASGHFQEEIVI